MSFRCLIGKCRTGFIISIVSLCGCCNVKDCADKRPLDNSPGYQVAVYYFPQWHVDPWNESWKGEGWSEWVTLKEAQPRVEGHLMPKVPLWGYEDESDPDAMARKIDAAADHGIDLFLWDWYWLVPTEGYTGGAEWEGPFLEAALEKGFMNATNNHRIKFAIMWANHDLGNFFPGHVDRDNFEKITQYCIDNYFSHPSYYRVDGKPYFSFYMIESLIKGLGSAENVRVALNDFRQRTIEAGFPGLHINGVNWGTGYPGNSNPPLEIKTTIAKTVNLDSIDDYTWIHNYFFEGFPITEYDWAKNKAVEYWAKAVAAYEIPYHPNVTMGWDPSPRCPADMQLEKNKYPCSQMIIDNTPDEFKSALAAARDFLDNNPECENMVSIYAWNEWTEGGYLEPDTDYGYQYLQAIKETFGKK